MKIIIIGTIASSFYGFRADLIKSLYNKGYVIYAFISEYKDADLEKINSLGAIPVIYELNRGGLNPLLDLIATYKLSQKIREIKPDIVFSYFSKPVFFGTLAAKLAAVPRRIGMLEGLGYTFTDQPNGISSKAKLIRNIQIFLYRITFPYLDTLIFLNPDDPIDLLKKYSLTIKSVSILGGIGLNLNEYPYRAAATINVQKMRFLFVGRLLKEKGIHEFVAAAKLVKKEYPDSQFTVLGAIDKSNLGALSETELLVPPQNSEALAEALKEAVNKTPLEIQENNLKARQRVEGLFSLEKLVENWLKIYRNE